jgi:glycine dehydrogenase subunit 1
MPYIQHTQDDLARMLKAVGVRSIDELFETLPQEARFSGPLDLPEPMCDMELMQHIAGIEKEILARDGVCFLGGGCYDHFIPAAVDELSMRAEFYTAYTPYQPETSQGVLQVFFEYQTLMARLTGMDISNASLYDGASGLAEAVLMAFAAARKKKKRVLVSQAVHPEALQTLRTYTLHAGLSVETVPLSDGVTDPKALALLLGDDVACVAAASPNVFGLVEDFGPLAEAAHDAKALFVAVSQPLALGVLAPPGAFGADIVTGEGQALGNPMSFGGPHFGFITAREKFVRSMPGRVVGLTDDSQGRRGFVLTFQTREQHIRREKATSNICTNQALCAIRATVYLALLGPQGLRNTAARCAIRAHELVERLCTIKGVERRFPGPFFLETVLRLPTAAETVARRLARRNIFVGPVLDQWFPDMGDCLLVAVTEKRTDSEMDLLCNALSEELQHL